VPIEEWSLGQVHLVVSSDTPNKVPARKKFPVFWLCVLRGGVNAMASVDDVAAAILERTGTVTTKKLQKLVYYTQAWHLVFENERIFNSRIEAWVQGPVVPHLYHQHKRFYEVSRWENGNPERLSRTEMKTVDWVVRQYGEFSAEALSRMTHMEVPWVAARGVSADNEPSTEEIDLRHMAVYYSRQRSSPDVAVAQVSASAAMEGISLDDEWQETLWEIASGAVSADEVIAEEIRRARNA
jgi:uncharacterized phage-associated protein